MSTEIITVAPNRYKSFARILAHEISKISGYEGKVWSVSQYKENEFQLSGSQFVIFIGNRSENSLTGDYISVINEIKKHSGACYGTDGKKAVIFGRGKLSEAKDFFKKREEVSDTTFEGNKKLKGMAIAEAIFVYNPLLGGGIFNTVPYYFTLRKKLRYEQTRIALFLFLKKEFDKWVFR